MLFAVFTSRKWFQQSFKFQILISTDQIEVLLALHHVNDFIIGTRGFVA
jgi:hypothetical protein